MFFEFCDVPHLEHNLEDKYWPIVWELETIFAAVLIDDALEMKNMKPEHIEQHLKHAMFEMGFPPGDMEIVPTAIWLREYRRAAAKSIYRYLAHADLEASFRAIRPDANAIKAATQASPRFADFIRSRGISGFHGPSAK